MNKQTWVDSSLLMVAYIHGRGGGCVGRSGGAPDPDAEKTSFKPE